MADNSTTEPGVDQTPGDSTNESLPENNQQPSADEQQDTGSSDSQSQDSGQDSGRQDDTTHESSDDDEGLAKYAKAQGFDPDNLTDGERKALKLARKQQQEFHKERQRQSEEARKALEDVHQTTDDDDMTADERLSAEIAGIKAVQRLQDFYQSTPDARDYDTEMGELLVEEEKQFGREAAQALARNMPRLLREAKARRGENGADAAREAGRREERERLRKAQEGGGETPSATSQSSSGKKLTREQVANMDDKEYAERREEIDAAIARGELY